MSEEWSEEDLKNGMNLIFGEKSYIIGYFLKDMEPGDTFGLVKLR